MEVHTHTHTPRKKWTHYFWEFLMLFLAVFCGFLAEYQLEHKIEKDRELVYIKSLVKDLEFDTLRFSRTINRIEEKLPYYDSVLLFFKNPGAFSNKLPFRFYIKTNIEQIYQPLSPTLQQLRNSGNLRLLTKKLVLDSIVIYDSRLNGAYRNQVQYIVDFNKRLIQMQENVFDNTNFNTYLNHLYKDSLSEDDTMYDIDLFTANKEKIMEMANVYINAKATDVFYTNLLWGTKNEATKLIALIKRQYHID
ncbi:MAG TPA: hypothetical protein VFV31_15425 [Chitinophagaceae bacterium]|nr:hypothetical protein [Chitinophagaceae bacterium]